MAEYLWQNADLWSIKNLRNKEFGSKLKKHFINLCKLGSKYKTILLICTNQDQNTKKV